MIRKGAKKNVADEEPMHECPFCCEMIPLRARRCSKCTSWLGVEGKEVEATNESRQASLISEDSKKMQQRCTTTEEGGSECAIMASP